MAGFECVFVEKPPKAFQSECPICLLVLREPYQATCCGKSFCKECIHRIKAANQACPTCNDKGFSLFHNKGLQQSLYDFQVYCTHKSKGCEWMGELRLLDNHINSDPPADKALQGCPYTPIKCPLSCAGCEKGVCRKDVKSHVNDKLLSHVMVQAAQMKSFEQQLQEYRSINTQLKAQLGKVKEHLTQRVTELETRVGELNMKFPMAAAKLPSSGQSQHPDTHVTGTFKPIGAEFTMTNFEEYRREDDEWYSSHFYTHPNGYKMCLRVNASGHGSGKGTHLSVFVHLMKGEFDDQLKWPFQGEITYKLLNQEEDKDHVIHVLEYSESTPEEACTRVITGERYSIGWGYGKFLPHGELQPKYLKNDCIKLCIKKVQLF